MAAEATEQFCVAEERSGHCAVVDGNFLYVWGGYVVRRQEAAGGRRGRAAEGRRGGVGGWGVCVLGWKRWKPSGGTTTRGGGKAV